MRVRAALLCALALLGVLPAVAGAAAPERGVLVVAGQGGTTGELVLAEEVRLDGRLPVLSGGGDYAGALVEPVAEGRQGTLGAVVVRAFRDASRDDVVVVGGIPLLEPGRYRVTLLGQGPVEVRWSMQDPGLPGVRVEPRTPTAVQFLGRSEVLPAGTATPPASVVLGRAVPAGKRVLQVALLDGTAVEDARMCVTTGSTCPGNPLPACLPEVGCGDEALPEPRIGTGESDGRGQLHEAAPTVRDLVWSSEAYYREAAGRLRAAAFVLG